ncbi:hypothetical protein [Leucobacter sp.]
MTSPHNTNASAVTPVPGKTLGIVALVLAVIAPLIGVILGIIASMQSRQAGAKNKPATVAMILGLVLTLLGMLIAWWVFGQAAQGIDAAQVCAQDPTAIVEIAGQAINCADVQ